MRVSNYEEPNVVAQPQTAEPSTVLYRERQWVPWYWWIFAFIVVGILTAQFAHNRSFAWLVGPLVIQSAIAVWVLVWLSKTTLIVEEDTQGTRWLIAESAILPDDVVSRSIAVPESARRNAMGRQLDPAAFVVSHGWVKEMVMLVLDDPRDPTPYWLIGTKNPTKLLRAFLPEQAEFAVKPLTQKA